MMFGKIQQKIAALIAAQPWFAAHGYETVLEGKGDVRKELEAKMAKTQSAILVKTPSFRPESNASKVSVGKVAIVVQCSERVFLNRARTGNAAAQDAAELVAWTLNLAPVSGVGVLVLKSISSSMLDAATLAWTVELETQAALGDPLAED